VGIPISCVPAARYLLLSIDPIATTLTVDNGLDGRAVNSGQRGDSHIAATITGEGEGSERNNQWNA
jgi:hypothetical protein